MVYCGESTPFLARVLLSVAANTLRQAVIFQIVEYLNVTCQFNRSVFVHASLACFAGLKPISGDVYSEEAVAKANMLLLGQTGTFTFTGCYDAECISIGEFLLNSTKKSASDLLVAEGVAARK